MLVVPEPSDARVSSTDRRIAESHQALPGVDDKDVADLLRWSVLPVLRIDDKSPPYSARLAFDFLSLDAQLEVDGDRICHLDRPESSFGRHHPVHQLEDNWFELHQ